MKLPIRKFLIKNIVPMLHKPHAGAYARGEGVGAKKTLGIDILQKLYYLRKGD